MKRAIPLVLVVAVLVASCGKKEEVRVGAPQPTQPTYTPPQPQPAAEQPEYAPVKPAVDTAALAAHREMVMLLGTRANAIKGSLNSMRQQQARMGVNLRQDIATAEQRMEFYLDDAEAAVKASDAARAKKSLESAERALETIEKFLGR